MGVAVEWIADERRFAELDKDWDLLIAGESTPFDLHCWYASWWKAFGGAQELAICVARRDGALVGVFPLRKDRGRLLPLANEHSPFFRPLASDSEALRALVSAVMDEAPPGFELGGLPVLDRSVRTLVSGVRSARRIPLIEPEYSSPAVNTGGDFEVWRTESKPRWEAQLERFRRKMGRDHEAEFTIVEPPLELDGELTDGFRVEASGWKGREGTAILSTPGTEMFYRELGRVFHGRGELHLSRIVLDAETAAFDFCILHRRRLYLLKTGYDERFRRLAPGLVMRLVVIERCFELRLDSHELLGRETKWKSKFANESRDFTILRTYPRGAIGTSKFAYRAHMRPRLKQAYRRLRPQDAMSR